MEHPPITLRPLRGREELSLFNRLTYTLDDELADDLAHGRRRPQWMWLALRGDRPLARLAWWSRPGTGTPFLLDVLDVLDADGGDAGGLSRDERVDVGGRLLRAATAAVLPPGAARPPYSRFVPARWRERAADRDAVETRMAIVERNGGRLFVERLRLEWRAGTPVAPPRGRLAFRSPSGPDELLDLMTSTLDGTLDAHSRADLARLTPREAAERHYADELARYTSPRSWWRVGVLPDGGPVGFVLPARNAYHPIIAYLGVLPEHRGRGYVDDLLAEGTRVLADQRVPRVRASTDLANSPMADAFRRAGYVDFQREVVMTWD